MKDNRNPNLQFRLPIPEQDALRRLANELGMTLSELLRLLISRGLEHLLSEGANGDAIAR